MIDEQVLGGDWEGAEPVRAQEKKHEVWEGVEGEVSPVLRGGSRLGPREGEPAARVPRAQDPVVRRVSMKGWGLQRGREPRGRAVDLRGRAHDPEVLQASLVR